MIDNGSLWLLGGLLLLAMLVAYEVGLRLHARLRVRTDGQGDGSSNESYALSGVFGLLALLMAFAFGLALDRFEERRVLVVAKANAIGTLASRLALAPEPSRPALLADLDRYADARLEVGLATDPARSNAALARADALYTRFGVRLYAALADGPGDARMTLLVPAYNETGDIAEERRAARAARLPAMVIALLALYCVAGATMLGYTVARSGAAHRLSAGVFFVLLAFAFATILDLDRPRGGGIHVPQDELERVAEALS